MTFSHSAGMVARMATHDRSQDDDADRPQIDQQPPVYLPAVPRSGPGSRGGWVYSDALGRAIADLYVDADAGGLWGLCAAAPDSIPPPTVLHAWKTQYPAFGLMMRAAERVRAERLIEQTIVIADSGSGSPPRLALQIATRQHLAERLDRARFGNGSASATPLVLSRDAQPVAIDLTDDVLAAIAVAGQSGDASGQGGGG